VAVEVRFEGSRALRGKESISVVSNTEYDSSVGRESLEYRGGMNASRFAIKFIFASLLLEMSALICVVGKEGEKREAIGRLEEKREREGMGRRFGRRGRVRM
jgi:hypothetical protein